VFSVFSAVNFSVTSVFSVATEFYSPPPGSGYRFHSLPIKF